MSSSKIQRDIQGPNAQRGQRGEKLDRKRTKSVILRLSKYILKHKFLFLIAIVLTLASNQLGLLGPLYSGYAIDAMTGPSGVDFQAVTQNVIVMLVCYILSGVLSYALAVLMVFISQKIVYSMRKELFEKLTTLPVSYFDTHPAGDIISRIS